VVGGRPSTQSLDRTTRHVPERDAELHRRLLAAIESGDEDEIAEEVRLHIAISADEIAKLLEDGGSA